MADRMTNEQLDTIHEFLESQSTLALATVNEDGCPQVAPLFYVSDEALNLYWMSSENSRHSLNLARQAAAAVTIYPHVWQWTEIRGLQIEGQVSIVTDLALRDSILPAYKARFNLPSAFDTQIAASALYVLKPIWMRWLDNSVRFGYKAEIVRR